MRGFVKTYGGVLLLCLAVRVGYIVTRDQLPPRAAFDGYVQIAENFLAGHGLTPSPLRHFHLRTPAYPLFVAGVWSLVPTAWRYAALAAAQALLAVATCGLLMRAARSAFDRRTAIAAGLLFALSPSYTIFSALVYTETLHLFLLMLAVLAAARLTLTARTRDAAWFGILWGLLGLNRPEATFLVPVLALPLVFHRGVSLPAKARALAVMLSMNLLVMTPWIVRNYHVYGAFVPHVPATGMNLFGGSYPHPPMYGRGWHHAEGLDHDLAYWETPEYRAIVEPYWDRAALARRSHWYEEVLARSERDFLAIDRALMTAARRQILADPPMYARNLLAHLAMLWARPAAWDVVKPGAVPRVAWFGAHLGLLVLAALGGVIAWRKGRLGGNAGAWLTFIAWHTLVILPIVTEPRYQTASAPFLFIFAGFTLSRFWESMPRKRTIVRHSDDSATWEPNLETALHV